jgi:hypothetical protein
MKYMTAVFILLLLPLSGLQAREIRLHFPEFSGAAYEWKIFQGEEERVVRTGTIPPDGRVRLAMPEAFGDYRGMTRWMLTQGGGLDMIYTGAEFSVACLSDRPERRNIIYTGNPENEFLSEQHLRQRSVLDKLGAMDHLLRVYAPGDALHQTAVAEQERLRRAFEKLQAERARSPLYAARFGEIVDFTRGVADRIYDNRADRAAYFNDFFTRTLDFNDLYTSGHWEQVLDQWLMMNLRSDGEGQAAAARLNAVLSRMDRDALVAGFVETAAPILVKTGRDDLMPLLADHLESRPAALGALPPGLKTMMASVKILTGQKAPDLEFSAPVRTGAGTSDRDIAIDTGRLGAAYTILLFYQGSCPRCEDALIDLSNQYEWLKARDVRVIAVSADTENEGYEKRLAYHQWPENYCDFTGTEGKNFTRYGVLGVPTLFLLDREGLVVKKTAGANEMVRIISGERRVDKELF